MNEIEIQMNETMSEENSPTKWKTFKTANPNCAKAIKVGSVVVQETFKTALFITSGTLGGVGTGGGLYQIFTPYWNAIKTVRQEIKIINEKKARQREDFDPEKANIFDTYTQPSTSGNQQPTIQMIKTKP